MSFSLTPTTTALKDQINKQPMLVLEVEGSQYLYGTSDILETARWDDDRITWDNDIGVTWDGEIPKANSKPYIMLKGETTKSLSQQLLVDKGGSGSVSTINVELIDYRGEVAQDLSFDQIGEPLGKKATVYIGLQGSRFPQDFYPLIKGFIDDLKYNAGSITVSVSLATNLVRQSSFEQYQSSLTSDIDGIVTTVPVETVEPFFESQDTCTSYIRIDEEIMEVVSKNTNDFTVIRARFGTLAASHDLDTEVVSNYNITGNPIDLALKLLHSKEGNDFAVTSTKITALNRINNTELLDGAIIVEDYDIENTSGLVAGDLINLVGTASNDGIKTVSGFGRLVTGSSYILVTDPMSEETGLDLSLQIKSQYNVLPDGAGLDIDFIDTPAFEFTKSTFSASFTDYSFLLKETIEDTREFIISQIFTPMGIYLIPRKAKTSCKFTAPPFSLEEVPRLNTQNLYDIGRIQFRRSTHKYLLNSIVFRYNEGILEDKFFNKLVRINADSFNRIPVGRKRRVIEARGLGRSLEVAQILDRISKSILNRYKFGARYVRNVKVLLSVGLNIEIGDIVFFGGEDTQLVNIKDGERNFPSVQFEVINRKFDALKGEIILELLETGFGIDGIFATYSPSSKIAAGSTVNRIFVDSFWGSDQYDTERNKWENWSGLKIRIRSDDYTYDETVTIDKMDPVTNNGILLEESLPSPPPIDGWIELAKYDEYGNEDIEDIIKLTHTFTTPQAEISNVTDNKTFDVLDTTDFEIGMQINVHAEDYTTDSQIRTIDDITGNTIILDSDLDITPSIEDKVEMYAYPDSKGYRFI